MRMRACNGGGAAGVNPLRRAVTSLEREGVHQTALGPGRIQAALELQRARLAHIALEHLAVIAAGLDRLQHPLVVEAKPRSEIASRAEQALDRWRRGLCHFVRIGGGDAEVLSFDQTV